MSKVAVSRITLSEIVDISAFKDVKDLRFFSSRGIGFKNVSSLRNAHSLFLSGILELTDATS